jgi:hypothetical protein
VKLFYICSAETTRYIPTGYHSLSLGNDKLLVCIHWTNEAHEHAWSSRPDVISLPHPIFEATQTLAEEHVQHLTGRYAVTTAHNIHHVIKEAAKEDLWMRLRVL